MQSLSIELPNTNFLKNTVNYLTRAKYPAQFSTQHSALSTQHSALSTQHSALSTQHSALSTQHSALSTQHNIAPDRVLTQKIDLPFRSAPLLCALKKYTSAKRTSIYQHSFGILSSGFQLQCCNFFLLFVLAHNALKNIVCRFSRLQESLFPTARKHISSSNVHPMDVVNWQNICFQRKSYIKLSRSGEYYEL